MSNSYTSLGEIKDLDTLGWKIDFNQILTPKRGIDPYIYLYDTFYESADKKYACLLYTIVEWTMMNYSGLIAIYENKEKPKLIVNPTTQWFSFEGDSTLFFDKDFLFIRKNAYNENPLLSGIPFIAIDLKNKKFGFIDFDASSIYYSIHYIESNIYKFNLDTPNEIMGSKFANHNGETFNLTTVKFYNIQDLDNTNDLYINMKKANLTNGN